MNKKVSIIWTMIGFMIPFVWIWSLCRIKKFRLGLLLVIPDAIMNKATLFNAEYMAWYIDVPVTDPLFILDSVLTWGWLIFSLYVVRRWAKSWNTKVERENKGLPDPDENKGLERMD